MLHAMRSNYQKMCMENIFDQKRLTTAKGDMDGLIKDGQLLFDRISDLLVVMELIVCKCNGMCKGPEYQWFSNALM